MSRTALAEMLVFILTSYLLVICVVSDKSIESAQSVAESSKHQSSSNPAYHDSKGRSVDATDPYTSAGINQEQSHPGAEPAPGAEAVRNESAEDPTQGEDRRSRKELEREFISSLRPVNTSEFLWGFIGSIVFSIVKVALLSLVFLIDPSTAQRWGELLG